MSGIDPRFFRQFFGATPMGQEYYPRGVRQNRQQPWERSESGYPEHASLHQHRHTRGVMSMLGTQGRPGARKQSRSGHHKMHGGRRQPDYGHPQGRATLGGSNPVSLGQQFLNQSSHSLRGRLPNFQAAGGVTNNCADFVSSLLQDTGRLRGHYNNVGQLEQGLQRQGYRRVSRGEAQPGDVWISARRGHTELVATPGAGRLLGSNGRSYQTIRYSGTGAGVFYHLGH